MELTREQERMLRGEAGRAAAKAMEILVALGRIFDAKALLPVRSVQVAGVSYSNLGDEGLAFLEELAEDGRARVPATLNPAGMDLERPERMGLAEAFVERQRRVIAAYGRLG
ncbi:MAG: aconitase X, partial [Polyangia bacterium]|nr:aconitase X [Polyangia bacterium]